MFEKHLVHDDEDVRGTIDTMDLDLLDLLNSTSNIACQFHIAMHVPYIQLWCLCRSSIVRLSGEQSNHQMFSLRFEFLGGTTTFVGLVDMIWHNMSRIIFYKLHGSLACSDLSTYCFSVTFTAHLFSCLGYIERAYVCLWETKFCAMTFLGGTILWK